MGSLAQVGLALATAVGAWINLLLVIGFAVRAGYLELDRALVRSLAKFARGRRRARRRRCGLPRGLRRRNFAQLSAFRDEAALLLLIVVGAVVYAGSILLLFGRGWLRSLVRS